MVRLAVVAVVALAAFGLYRWLQKPPVQVKAFEVKRGMVAQTVPFSEAGTVTAGDVARVAATVSARVAHIPVEEGDRVAKGTPVVVLDESDLRDQAAVARLAAQTARRQLAQARLQLENFRREFQRQRALAEQNVISDAQWEQTQDELRVREQQVEIAEAQLEQARLQADIAAENVQETVLRAPFDGVVTEINAEVGQVPNPTQPVFVLMNTASLRVEGTVDEIDAPRIKRGMDALLTNDAFPDREFPGTVTRVAGYVTSTQRQARIVPVEIALAGQAPFIVGMSVDAEIIVDRSDNVLYAPTFSVFEEEGETYVYRIADLNLPFGRAEKTAVSTGMQSNDFVEITRGLEGGDRIVTSLDQQVEDGARVEVVERITRRQ